MSLDEWMIPLDHKNDDSVNEEQEIMVIMTMMIMMTVLGGS